MSPVEKYFAPPGTWLIIWILYGVEEMRAAGGVFGRAALWRWLVLGLLISLNLRNRHGG